MTPFFSSDDVFTSVEDFFEVCSKKTEKTIKNICPVCNKSFEEEIEEISKEESNRYYPPLPLICCQKCKNINLKKSVLKNSREYENILKCSLIDLE